MSTVDKSIADAIVAGKYADDQPTRIVDYDNAWGGIAYGVTFGRQAKDTYMQPTNFIRNPRIYWDADTTEE